MLIDEVVIEISAGKGGDGAVAFRREKYVDKGGPAGGNGGAGGSVIFVGYEGKNTLLDLRYQKHIKAKNGENGKSKNMNGKDASNTYIKVPLGTLVSDLNGKLIGEVTKHNEELVVAHGGRGGRGNTSFKSNKNQAPEFAEKGLPGESLKVKVELKIMADVGLVGFPNAGKSTLLSSISNARPKIDSYPFTTLEPNLGMVNYFDHDFIVADIPGILENAHQGVGLGLRFLRHIERCRVFVYVLDISESSPLNQYQILKNELKAYDEKLIDRPELILLSKCDLVDDAKIAQIKKDFSNAIFVSALTTWNLDELLKQLVNILKDLPPIQLVPDIKIYDEPLLNEKLYEIKIIDDIFIITGDVIEKLFYRTDFSNDASVKRFSYQLRSLGIDQQLRKLGVSNGDTIRILNYEFEFFD
ncbi:MAG: GTPase ObgE [Acholeplasmataceae bacterium]|nr:GTPase ObgE [Acholeplasmataceae bacterium]